MTVRQFSEDCPDVDAAPGPLLLRGKVLPPSLHRGVHRGALVDAISRQRSAPVTTLVAPAGFGKTVLLLQYLQAVDGVATAWLSLDRDMQKPEQFLAYLVFALREAGVAMPESDGGCGEPGSTANLRDRLAVLLHHMEQAGPLRVVLDGFHLAESADVVALLQYLIDNLPVQAHLLLSSRFTPGLALAELQLNGRSVSLVERDLRFTEDETRQLFSAGGSPERIRSLHERCEGWPAALQLAKMAQASELSADSGDLLAASGLAAYLTQQVMTDVDGEEERFVLETSMLHRFDAELADYVRGRDDSRHLLRRLTRLSPLLNEREGACAYHGLLREYLLDRLRETQPQRFRVLCDRAAVWFEEHGQVNRAVEVSCFAGDYQKAVDVIQRAGGWRILLQFGPDLLQRVLSHFSPQVISRFDELQICRFFLLLKDGQFAEARRRMDEWQRLQAVPVYPEYPDMMELAYEMYTDLPVSDESPAKTAAIISMLPHTGVEELHAILRTMQLVQLISLGRLEEAQASGREGMQYLRQTDLRYALNFFYFHLGMLHVMACDVDRAQEFYESGTELARREFGKTYSLPSVGEVLLAETHYLRNGLDDCRALLEDALPQVTVHDGWCEMYIVAYSTAVRLAYATQSLDAALTIADQCLAVAEDRRLERLAATAEFLRAESLIRSGLVQNGERALHGVDRHLGPDWRTKPFFWQLQHLELLARLRAALARQQWERAKELLGEAPRPRAELHGLERALMEVALYASQGLVKEAAALFLPLVDTLVHGGLSRLVLDVGDALLPPITTLLQQQVVTDPGCREFMTALLRDLGGKPEAIENSLDVALSDREYQVLELLAQGLPNKLIARQLGTSENTVKFHLKNLFRKLSVTKRVAAIHVAREQGLLR